MPKLKRISLSSPALMGVVALALVLCLSWGSVGRADVITRTVGITTVFPEQYDSLSRRAVPFPMPEDGTITSVAMFHDGGSGGMILAVYDNGGDNKPNNRTAITAETPTDPSAGWQTIDLITPVEVSTGAKIWLAWVGCTRTRSPTELEGVTLDGEEPKPAARPSIGPIHPECRRRLALAS